LSLPTFKEGTTAIQGNDKSTYKPDLTKQRTQYIPPFMRWIPYISSCRALLMLVTSD